MVVSAAQDFDAWLQVHGIRELLSEYVDFQNLIDRARFSDKRRSSFDGNGNTSNSRENRGRGHHHNNHNPTPCHNDSYAASPGLARFRAAELASFGETPSGIATLLVSEEKRITRSVSSQASLLAKNMASLGRRISSLAIEAGHAYDNARMRFREEIRALKMIDGKDRDDTWDDVDEEDDDRNALLEEEIAHFTARSSALVVAARSISSRAAALDTFARQNAVLLNIAAGMSKDSVSPFSPATCLNNVLGVVDGFEDTAYTRVGEETDFSDDDDDYDDDYQDGRGGKKGGRRHPGGGIYTRDASGIFRANKTHHRVMTSSPIDGVIVSLSDAHDLIRSIQTGTAGSESKSRKWNPPATFERKTTKYWVRLDKVPRLKLDIVEHLPILVFGRPAASTNAMNTPQISKQHDSGDISSVYFDNWNLESYHTRQRRLEGATLVRIRWYGSDYAPPGGWDGDDSSNKKRKAHVKKTGGVFVERKTHHESWRKSESVKERFKLSSNEIVSRYLCGETKVNKDLLLACGNEKGSVAYAEELAGQIQDEVSAYDLTAKVRTMYRRAAFQLSTSNEVRISLDTRLRMVRDYPDIAGGYGRYNRDGNDDSDASDSDDIRRRPSSRKRSANKWCRDLNTYPPGPEDVVRFPYAILEVKLQGGEPPVWVESALEEADAVPVHKFSKFLHGMATLYPERVKVFPHWFESVEAASFSPDWESDAREVAVTYMAQSAERSSIIISSSDDGSSDSEGYYGISENEDDHHDDGGFSWAKKPSSKAGKARKRNGKTKNGSEGHNKPPLLVANAHAGAPPAPRPPPRPPLGAGGGAGGGVDEKKRALLRRKALAKPIRIEPKTFFAIERTLLQWLNTLLILSLGSLSALVYARDQDSDFALAAGAVLGAVVVLFGFYTLYIYFKRLNALTHGTAIRFDDRVGPPVLIVVLSTVMVVSVILSLNRGGNTL